MRSVGIELTAEQKSLGSVCYSALVDIGEDRKIMTFVCIYENTNEIERIEVDLYWWTLGKGDPEELTAEEYDQPIVITFGDISIEDTVIGYCMKETLVMRKGGPDNVKQPEHALEG